MYLKKITVEGFKSFGERLSIDFHKGLTVVVGPNGSGKSNILDAIKWVFGTRSLKDIRIDEIKNVLFHGVNKNAHFAQVEATLGYENDSDAEDTTIGRRLYEDGAYEYYLNGQLVRLKDIKEFLTKNASAFTNYSLFEQNNVDSILRISAKERAKFFEEIAGLSYYRLKYEETLRTLEKVKEKFVPLERKIKDMQNERMALQKEAQETKEYLQLIDELKTTKKQIITMSLWKMYKEMDSYKTDVETLEKELLNLYESLVKSDIDRNSIKANLNDVRSGLDFLNEEITNLVSVKNKNLEQLRIQQAEFQQFKEEFNKLLTNQDILNKEVITIKEKLSSFTTQKVRIETDLMSLDQYLDSLNEVQGNLIENKNTAQNEVKICEKKLLEANWKMTNANNEANRIEEELKQENTNLTETLKKISSKNTTKSDYSKKMVDLKNSINELNLALQQKKNDFQAMELETRTLEDSKIKKQTEIEFLHSEIDKLNSEKKDIIEQIETEEKGLKQYLEIMKSNGVDAELLFNEIELAKGISDDMLKFIGMFETSVLCRSLPESVDVIPPVNVIFVLPSQIDAQQKDSLLNFLKTNFIKCKNENYIENLYTVFNYYLSKQSNLIALDGKLFVRLGQTTPKITNLHYALIKLNDRSIKINEQIKKTEELLSEYETKINKLKEAIALKRTQIYEVSVDIQAKTKEYEDIVKQVELLDNEIQYLSNTAELVRNKVANLHLEKENTTKQRNSIKESIVALKNEYDSKTELLKSIEIECNDLSNKIEELKTTRGKEQSRLVDITNNINEYESRLKEIDEEVHKTQKLRLEKESINKRYEEAIQELNRLIEGNDIVYRALDECKNCIGAVEKKYYSEYEILEEQVKKIKKMYGEKKLESGECSYKLGAVNDKITELKNLYMEEFKEECKVDFANNDSINIIEDEDMLKQRIKVCEDKLSTFKNINMSAVDKLSRLEQELSSLEGEYTKLSAVMSELSIFLNNLETEASNVFEDTVKSVSESFNKYIRKLFEGGKAQVQLLKDIKNKEYEVNLNVQIPNKNVKLIESFSGGERALVSLALLFSFLELKPSPFYILDEIDASLDDNNLSKLLALLKEISYNQQIVMISHSKHTLNIADYIIGVTIGEGSYTRIVGIDLKQALAYAAE